MRQSALTLFAFFLVQAVLKGVDDGSWRPVSRRGARTSDGVGVKTQSAGAHTVLREPLLLQAKRVVEDVCHGRMLCILAAVCRFSAMARLHTHARTHTHTHTHKHTLIHHTHTHTHTHTQIHRCSAMAREEAAAGLLRAIFRKRSGKPFFLHMYVEHAARAAAQGSGGEHREVQDKESAQTDMKVMWETLFWSAHRLCQRGGGGGGGGGGGPPASYEKCQSTVIWSTVICAIAYCLQHVQTQHMPDIMLAPLMRARPMCLLLECACAPPESNIRIQALMALAELVGVGGQSHGLADSKLLWSLLEQDILCDSDCVCVCWWGSAKSSEQGLQRILRVCEARSSDCAETMWCGFDFVMSVFSPHRCPRIHALVDPQVRGRGGEGGREREREGEREL